MKREDMIELAFEFSEFMRDKFADNEKKLTPNEFFTSILIGMYAIYSENFSMDEHIDNSIVDIINFTYILNRLAIQHIMDGEE